MVKRWQSNEVLSVLSERRGVHLTGARQCGKTTLAESLALASSRRYTFDNIAVRRVAASDPYEFVRHGQGETLVIDEVQKVPEVLEGIKMILDHDNTPGQYLLTGSSNLRFAKAIKDSLAGRLRTVRLRTLALGEIEGGEGDFLSRVILRSLKNQYPELTKRDVIHEAFLGGYPEARGLSTKERRHWYEGYLNDLLMRDIEDVAEIRKFAALSKMAEWLLAHSSKFFNQDELCRAVGIGRETATAYLAALKALYIFDDVEPWTARDYAKCGKRSKYFASDPGLVTNILDWDEEGVYMDDDRSGKIVENWVYHELASICDKAGDFRFLQYRDSDRREIDFVLKRDDGSVVGIEVKAGSNIGKDDFRQLDWFNRTFCKERFTGVLLYSGSDTLQFGDNLLAVPYSALCQ